MEDAAEKLVLSSTSDLSDESSNEKLLDDSDSHSYIDSAEWKAKKKHIFVLSEAGKPIYSR